MTDRTSREQMVVMNGKPTGRPIEGTEVRPLREADLCECEVLCKRVHGFERTNELRGAMQAFPPFTGMRAARRLT